MPSCRCRCFVTPGAVSSCEANCRPEDCTAWTKLSSSLQQIASTMIDQSAPFDQVGILFPFLYFTSVCLLLATFFFWVSLFYFFFFLFRCLPSPNLYSTLANYPSPVSGHGRVSIPNRMPFLSNKIVPWAVCPVFLFALI